MRISPRKVWQVLSTAVSEFFADNSFVLAASIAFFTIFSLAPIILVVIAVAGAVFGRDETRQEIYQQFSSLMGPESAELVAGAVSRAGADQQTGTVATVVGLVTLLIGATGVFVQLKAALNQVWGIEVRPAKTTGAILRLVRSRIMSFAMILVIAFLLLASLVVSAGLAALGRWGAGLLPGQEVLMRVANWVVSFGVLAFLFAAAYKLLPDLKVRWRVVWLGGALTALLFTVGKELIGLYLGSDSLASAYGAAGSLIIVLMWVYYSSVIFLFGAEITQATATALGWGIAPTELTRTLDKQRSREPVPAGRAAGSDVLERERRQAAHRVAEQRRGARGAERP
ncbi:MAG TPA: YihY/virulence factor BrkB family protein [Phycisphaerales bacterium]|nr:YihY/virulence factor BrkB family protein [Phycisphaerales bacterium]